MENFNRDLDRQFEDKHDLYRQKISAITRPGMTKDDMLEVYDKWIESYEDVSNIFYYL